MNELRAHLEGNTSQLFPPQELNHVLLMVYGVLRRAVRDGADQFTLTPTRLQWSRQGTPLGEFRTEPPKPAISFRAMLEKIVARDPIVQQHLQLVAESPEELTYRLQDVPVEQAA
jgi:hypothetical protein